METIRARSARNQQLTKRQQEIVVGSLLGDGYLAKTTRGHALRINHSMGQKAYVDWKYHELETFTNSGPCHWRESYYFRTISHPYLEQLYHQWYSGGGKKLPPQLEQWMTPLVFTVWCMDDGSKDKGQLRLNSQSFSREENERLIQILEATLGINATLNRDKDKFRLRISEASMPRMRQIVAPYLIPSMQYKLSP